MDFRALKHLKPGGRADTAALLASSAALFATHPLAGIGVKAAAAIAMGGASITGAHFFSRYREAFGIHPYFDSELKIRSSKPIKIKKGEKAYCLGYIVDTGKPLMLPMEDAVRHMSIVGQSGVGKTVFGQWLMLQQMMAGGGIVFMDGKLDGDTLLEFQRMAAWAGRTQDVVVINPGNPDLSNTYNPILYGDPDEVGDRIIGLIPSTESQAGADHYKQTAKQAVTTLIRALQKTKLAYTFIDLVILLQSPSDLEALEHSLPQCPERTNLSIFLENYKVPDKNGEKKIDMKRLKETFGGIAGRLYSFGTGSFGDVMNTTSPECKLFDAMRMNKLVYVMMPTMGKPETASSFGKMFLGDARTAFSWLQALQAHQKPNPPLLFFMDELGSYATPQLARPFEQNRSAGVILLPAYQTYSNLESVSPEFAQMVLGNTWTKVFFKPGSQETAVDSADMIGMETTVQDSLSVSGGQGASNKAAGSATEAGASENESLGFSEREQETYRVSPDELKSLDKGEAIVTIGGDRIYHIRIPRIVFDERIRAEYPKPRINHYRTKHVTGIDLFRHAQERYAISDPNNNHAQSHQG